jgi:hypothetical protein
MKQLYPIQVSGGVRDQHIMTGLSAITDGGLVSELMKRGQL